MQAKKWLLLLVVFLVVSCQMFTAAPTPTAEIPTPENSPHLKTHLSPYHPAHQGK